MLTICAIRTGRTESEEQQRVESVAGSRLCADGIEQVRQAAEKLADKNVSAIYCGMGEAEQQSAAILAEKLGLKLRSDENLHELDYGLWQGLTFDEIKRRQPKVLRQWLEQPSSVRPPGGETIDDAQLRLREALKAIARKHKDETVLLVLRPVLLCLLRSILLNQPVDTLWPQVYTQSEPLCQQVDDRTL